MNKKSTEFFRKLHKPLISLLSFCEEKILRLKLPTLRPDRVKLSENRRPVMDSLTIEAAAFRGRLHAERRDAAQRAALQLLCGIDLNEALDASMSEKQAVIRRIVRTLKAERIKGLKRHWSYDLNRHIALKQALDRLQDAISAGTRAAGQDALKS